MTTGTGGQAAQSLPAHPENLQEGNAKEDHKNMILFVLLDRTSHQH